MTSILFIFVCFAICMFALRLVVFMIFSVFDLMLAVIDHAKIAHDMYLYDRNDGISRQHSRSVYRRRVQSI